VAYPFPTLPDLLGDGPLDLVFVGINPSTEAVRQGHYFAGRQNRFWPALSRSRLGRPLREHLGTLHLQPHHDRHLPGFGIGLTDVVKEPSAMASELTRHHFQSWAPLLHARLASHPARLVCFQGLTGYRPFLRHALGQDSRNVVLGPQPVHLAGARVWVVPNPSAANAHVRLEDLVVWYDRLAGELSR